ncbi:MAG: hypothetical protein H6Q90_4811 [Deltaproteobacteria bacterium]|nr:hypothetical protein [Deltaproteobacteria bacterium]
MKHLLARLALTAIVAAPSVGCVVHGRAHVGVPVAFVEVEEAPPPPRTIVVETRPGFVWVEGRWAHRGGRYIWLDGRWERERANHYWVQGRWERRGRGHVWVEGGWRAGGNVRDHRNGPPVRDHRERPVVRDHR